ncbi:MAG: DMT family transporter [Methylophilaceae bacterium]
MLSLHKGVLWMIIATLFFALMGTCVKLGAIYFSETELVFYRSVISLFFVILIAKSKNINLGTQYIHLHLFRSFMGFFSLLAFFYAISKLPLSTAISLNHTSPLFIGLLIPLILNKKLKKWLFFIICVGLLGIFLILKPTFNNQSYLAGFIGLTSGFGAALSYLFIIKLSQRKEPDIRTVFYFTSISTIGSGIILLFKDIHPPQINHFWILIGLGLSATIAQIALTKAYRVGNALGNAGLSYLTVIFSTIIGLIWFKEFLDWQSSIGIILIIISGIFASKK